MIGVAGEDTGKRRRRRRGSILLFVVLTAALLCPSAFAAGDGSGGGGGAVIPLYMDWSYPADGASGVSVAPVIQCKFSHNVAQYNVADRNKTLITLKKADGTNVDITVFVADAQLQFDKRQFLYVSPVKPLSYGTKYILTLHEGIQAKNNMATDEEQTVTFTTEYGRSSFNAPLVTPPADNDPKAAGSGSGTDAEAAATGSAGGQAGNNGETGAESSASAAGDEENGISGEENDSDENAAGGEGESSGQADKSSDSSSGENIRSFFSSSEFRGFLLILLLLLTGAVGGLISAAWMKKRLRPDGILKTRRKALADAICDGAGSIKKEISGKTADEYGGKRQRTAKHLSLFLITAVTANVILSAVAPVSHASVPEGFTVRLKIGDKIVSEKTYTDSQLRAMKQTRQIYSGINEEGYPCAIAAEGILLNDLAKTQGVDPSEIESISIHGAGNWTRNMTNNYLYGVKRYRYPHLSEAYRIENGMESLESGKNQGSSPETKNQSPSAGQNAGASGSGADSDGSGRTDAADSPDQQGQSGNTAGDSGSKGESDTNPVELKKKNPESVAPMLALRSNASQLRDDVSYSSLSAIEGYRFCFGQLNPSDGSYLMYGYNLQAIDIKVTAAGEFAEKMGMKDTEGNKKMTSGGADSAGRAEVEGPYTDPFTGAVTDHLPDELTVQVGYFGTEYYTIKKFTFDEIASMPLTRQAYSSVSSDGTNGILTAMGVRLVDLITASGIDMDSVEKIGFYQGAEEGCPGVTASKAYLIDMNRYYYPNLTAAWNYTTGGKGAARSAVRVDTVIALKDYWDEKSTVPDFFRMDGTHRYHLVYGQTSVKSNNLDKSLLWIDTIKVQLYGSPSDENWVDEYLGKVVGSGEGNGAGIGGSGAGSSASESEPDGTSGEAAETEPEKFKKNDNSLEKIDAAGKHVYEIAGGSVSYSLGSERKDYRIYIAAIFGAAFLLGGGASFYAYRRRMR